VSTLSGACVLCVLVRHLNGVSWVQRGLVEIAVGHRLTACYEIRAVVCSLPGRRSSWELDSASCLVACAA
jgi:hypothetical protein